MTLEIRAKRLAERPKCRFAWDGNPPFEHKHWCRRIPSHAAPACRCECGATFTRKRKR